MTDNASRKRRVEGYVPSHDIDQAYGAQGELIVTDIAEAIRTGMAEVKRDARWHDTRNLYVEYQCRRASGWKPSGIAVSDALVWVFVLGDTEAAIVVPAELLKELCKELYRKGEWYRLELVRGSHPTKGVRVPIDELFRWLALKQKHMLRGAA